MHPHPRSSSNRERPLPKSGWLHRESIWLLDRWATRKFSKPYDQLAAVEQAGLREQLKQELRTNTHDPASGSLVVSEDRAAAIAAVGAHYAGLFGNDPSLAKLREDYAIPANSIKDASRQRRGSSAMA